MEKLNCNNFDRRQDNSFFVPGERSSYLFNSQISGIDSSDLCLLIGSNPKIEASILNSRIRKRYLNSDSFIIGYIGEDIQLNYKFQNLGESPRILKQILDGKHEFSKHLKKSKKLIGL